jgi:hypothetical protein
LKTCVIFPSNERKGWKGKIPIQRALFERGSISIVLQCYRKDWQVHFMKMVLWVQYGILEQYHTNDYLSEYHTPFAGHGNAMHWLAKYSWNGVLKGGSSSSTIGGSVKNKCFITGFP